VSVCYTSIFIYYLYRFIISAFRTTLTDENAIAAAAMAGLSSQPKKGYKIPAAIGMPAAALIRLGL